jgi:hypothetical protein
VSVIDPTSDKPLSDASTFEATRRSNSLALRETQGAIPQSTANTAQVVNTAQVRNSTQVKNTAQVRSTPQVNNTAQVQDTAQFSNIPATEMLSTTLNSLLYSAEAESLLGPHPPHTRNSTLLDKEVLREVPEHLLTSPIPLD